MSTKASETCSFPVVKLSNVRANVCLPEAFFRLRIRPVPAAEQAVPVTHHLWEAEADQVEAASVPQEISRRPVYLADSARRAMLLLRADLHRGVLAPRHQGRVAQAVV